MQSETPTADSCLLVSKMFCFSNDLYGNNIASAHELANGYTRPVTHDFPKCLPLEIRKSQDEPLAKRKLNLILSSKSINDCRVRVGDIVQVYTRLQNQKRGSWSEPKPVLEYDPASGTVTVAGSHGHRKQAALEDTRHAVSDNAFAAEIQQAIDRLSADIETNLETIQEDSDIFDNPSGNRGSVNVLTEDKLMDDPPMFELLSEKQQNRNPPPNESPVDENLLTYNPNTVDNHDSSTVVSAAPSTHSMITRSQNVAGNSHYSVRGHDIELLPGTELRSTELLALKQYHDRFRCKEFMLHQAEGLPSYITTNAYSTAEHNFIKECHCIHRTKVPTYSSLRICPRIDGQRWTLWSALEGSRSVCSRII